MVGMTLDEINHRGKVIEALTFSPALNFLPNTEFAAICPADTVRRSCGIPFLHMQQSALVTWDNGLRLKYFAQGVGGNCSTSDGVPES